MCFWLESFKFGSVIINQEGCSIAGCHAGTATFGVKLRDDGSLRLGAFPCPQRRPVSGQNDKRLGAAYSCGDHCFPFPRCGRVDRLGDGYNSPANSPFRKRTERRGRKREQRHNLDYYWSVFTIANSYS